MAQTGLSLYVGCGLTQAPEEFKHEVEAFKDRMRDRYEVFDFVGLEGGTPQEVYNWDIEHCTAKCDLLVAVCDYPSIGLGYELSARLRDFRKPALGLVQEGSSITRLVLGIPHPEFNFRRYGTLLVDAPQMVEEEVERLELQSAATQL